MSLRNLRLMTVSFVSSETHRLPAAGRDPCRPAAQAIKGGCLRLQYTEGSSVYQEEDLRVAADQRTAAGRKPRADAERNRARPARRPRRRPSRTKGSGRQPRGDRAPAGVGIGTLYRHFPTRDALVVAVYRNETRAARRGRDAARQDASAGRGAARLDAAVRRLYRHQAGHGRGAQLARRRHLRALRGLRRAR